MPTARATALLCPQFLVIAVLSLTLTTSSVQAESTLSAVSGRVVERLYPSFAGSIQIEVLTVMADGSIHAESQLLRMGAAKDGVLPSNAPRWRTDLVSWHFHVNMPAWMEPVFIEALQVQSDFSLSGPTLVLGSERVDLSFDLLDGTNMVFVDEDEEFLDEFLGAGVIAAVFRHNNNETGETIGSEMMLAKGAPEWLSDTLRLDLLFAEELFAHEIGHTMGLPHSCGDIDSPPCIEGTVENQATMNANLNFDMRGTTLMEWDLMVMEELYGAQGSCVADATKLCLPGASLDDPRFEVTVFVDTEIGPGFEGPGVALPLDSIGVRRGGLFWFFDETNPEVLIKILEGCPVTGHWWVFLSAGTTVGLDVTIVDTMTGAVVWTFSNPDNNAVQSVTDTAAFTCG